MITQIYSVQKVEEALACAAAGVDIIGMASGTNKGLPNEISLEQGKEIMAALKGKTLRSALTVADGPEEIYELITALQPDIVHLCGYDYYATPEFCDKARELVPGILIEQAIGVLNHDSVEEAVKYSQFCDILILDSVDTNIGGVGAAGFSHDWNLSKEIVERANCKVILAGGLGPDNVEAAIKKVQPWGVDSLTRTNGADSLKDIKKVTAFVDNTKKASAELGI